MASACADVRCALFVFVMDLGKGLALLAKAEQCCASPWCLLVLCRRMQCHCWRAPRKALRTCTPMATFTETSRCRQDREREDCQAGCQLVSHPALGTHTGSLQQPSNAHHQPNTNTTCCHREPCRLKTCLLAVTPRTSPPASPQSRHPLPGAEAPCACGLGGRLSARLTRRWTWKLPSSWWCATSRSRRRESRSSARQAPSQPSCATLVGVFAGCVGAHVSAGSPTHPLVALEWRCQLCGDLFILTLCTYRSSREASRGAGAGGGLGRHSHAPGGWVAPCLGWSHCRGALSCVFAVCQTQLRVGLKELGREDC